MVRYLLWPCSSRAMDSCLSCRGHVVVELWIVVYCGHVVTELWLCEYCAHVIAKLWIRFDLLYVCSSQAIRGFLSMY